MPKPGIKLELLIAGGTILVCGIATAFCANLARYALSEMYDGTGFLGPETQFAIRALWWAPIFYGLLLAVLIVWKLRQPKCQWITWAVLSATALATALVLFGVVSPFATTMFRMNNSG